MSIEIIADIVAGVAASISAASAISALKEFLSRRMQKIKVGGVEIEINSSKPSDAIYDQLSSTLSQLKQHPQVFLMYPHEQKEFALMLSSDLEKAGVKVWLDTNELKPGDNIALKIQEAIRDSQWILLVPPIGQKKDGWVNKEMQMAFNSEKSRERPLIIPIKTKQGIIPENLKDRLWADFSNRYEDGLKNLLRGIIRVTDLT